MGQTSDLEGLREGIIGKIKTYTCTVRVTVDTSSITHNNNITCFFTAFRGRWRTFRAGKMRVWVRLASGPR